MAELKEKGVDFVSLQDGINTSTATGRFTFNVFASLAELEREIANILGIGRATCYRYLGLEQDAIQ